MENLGNKFEEAQNQQDYLGFSAALNRVSNRISAKVALLLSALAASSCGGNVTVGDNMLGDYPDAQAPDAQAPDAEHACSPVPNCPAVPVSIYNPQQPDEDYYFETDRWYRINPETKDVTIVCEPVHKEECAPGQTPQKDNCTIPICKDAKTCDPVPSAKSKDQPWRMPYVANLPINSDSSFYNPFEFENHQRYPIIFDNTPDCAPGETPATESYYTCDIIPTCEKTIPYCDPLPRCNPGQSPISCEESPKMQRFSYKDDCTENYNNLINWLAMQGVNPDPITLNADLCEKKHDDSINEDYYQMPLISVNCRHIPECADGEVPVKKAAEIYYDCGKWYQGSQTFDYAPSCDPIKSCKQ